MHQEHFRRAAVHAIQQQACTFLGHNGDRTAPDNQIYSI